MSANHSDCRYAIRGDRGPVTGSRYTTMNKCYIMSHIIPVCESAHLFSVLGVRSWRAVSVDAWRTCSESVLHCQLQRRKQHGVWTGISGRHVQLETWTAENAPASGEQRCSEFTSL